MADTGRDRRAWEACSDWQGESKPGSDSVDNPGDGIDYCSRRRMDTWRAAGRVDKSARWVQLVDSRDDRRLAVHNERRVVDSSLAVDSEAGRSCLDEVDDDLVVAELEI